MRKPNGSECWVGVWDSGNPKDGKRYWWKWDQCRTLNTGSFNASFSGTGSGCSAGRAYSVNTNVPANLQVTGVPVCSVAPYPVNFSWQNTNSVLWLDVADNPGFSGFVNKNVNNLTSTSSAGFDLRPGRTYYWRLWNGSTHTNGPSFSTPECNLTVDNKPSCSDTPYSVTLNWQNPSPGLYADISSNSFAPFSNKDVGNQSSTTAPTGFNPTLTLNPGTIYLWRLWNGSYHINGPQWSVPLCAKAWIQTIGGDVHSNVSIKMRGN